MAKKLTSTKAKKILHDKTVHGKPLTDKQRRFFGAIASGAIPQAQNGIEGTMGGLTDIGFNYNGAWGGTMQDGGLTFLEPTSRKLPKGYVIPYNTPSTELAMSIGGVGNEPAYLIPSFKYGRLLEDPVAEFRKTGEHLGGPFKTYQEADEWERTVRHPYVEKGQSIPTPLKRWGKDFAMGGGIPGAVGFTYARTAGAAPANGPYAKKTKASAQDGKNVEYMELPEITVVGSKDKGTRDFYNNLIDTFSKGRNTNNPFVNQQVMGNYLGVMNLGKEYGFPKVKPETKSGIYKNAKGHYNPLTKTIYANNPDTWLSEMAHHVQMKDNVVGKGVQWLTNDLPAYLEKPMMELRNAFKYGINATPLDYSEDDFFEWSQSTPYSKKGTVEHEAHSVIEPMLKEKIKNARKDYKNSPVSEASKKRFRYEKRNLQNGGEMKYYQEGLDFKPKTISQDGSILTPYGQWEYPGEITTIPSNEITMQGVPYPVLGISDIGDVQMMYPGQDYTFDGKSVTEYPMMQGGGSLPTRGDSLRVYNAQLALNNFYNKEVKAGRLKKSTQLPFDVYPKIFDNELTSRNLEFYRETISDRKRRDQRGGGYFDDQYKKYFNLTPEQVKKLENQGLGITKSSTPNVEYYRDLITPMQNLASPFAVFDKRIKPQRVIGYSPASGDVGDYPGGEVSVYDYDPLAVKPYDLRTPQEKIEWEKRYGKPKKEKPDQFGLTKEDYITARKSKFVPTPGNKKGDGYYELKKDGKPYKIYTSSGGNSWVDVPSKPAPVKKTEQPKLQPLEPIKKIEQPKPVEKKQNVYEGTPVYSATVGSGGPSALVGFANQKGDTTFIKPEDYERFGVPKYGREYIEKATNKFRDGGISVNEADAQPIKKLDQLLNFTNYNDMAKAKKGKKLPKAQFGIPSEYNLNLAQYDPKTQMFNSPTGRISMYDTTSLGFTNTGSKMGAFTNINDVNNALGDMGGIGGASTQILGGVQQLLEERKQRQKTKQFAALSDVAVQAATSKPVGIQRKYVRPEDMLVNPGEVSSPYGTGYDFLQAESGALIGGNPTEIQNMYNPGTLYSDLGYEPLEDSNQVKQFEHGGKAQFGTVQAGQLGSTFGSFLGGGGGQQSGAGTIGSAVGGIAGNLLLPGIGGPIGSALGGLVGGAIGGQSQRKMEQMQMRAQGNLGTAALQQSLQGQFSAYMEDGGELKYLSHDWQPQVITKFGEYDVKDLLKAPKDADMLRAGGHLKEYTPPSESAMSTERPDFQMGGELQTHWGGYAETISENPYLPDGGETVMFRGQSHEESDGKGRTGIGITYGNNPVEVERGEPAVKLKDGGTGQDSMVVFGNMKIPSYGASELNDPKAKGMKFKRYAEDLSKIENKANKVSDKALKLIDETDGDDQFGLLSLSTANIMMKGSDMKLKDAAMKKQLAAGIQSAILDTAEELGIENDALAKGKIKSAKGGGKFTSAQVGINQPLTPILPVNTYYKVPVRENEVMKTTPAVEELIKQQQAQVPPVKKKSSKVAKAAATAAPIKRELAKLDFEPRELSDMSPIVEVDSLKTTTPGIEKLKAFEAVQPTEDKFDLLDFANMLSPYTRPLLRNPLDPGQLAPEMMALATNVVEPVQAQQFRPMLEQAPTVSFQDQLNEIQAEANAARRLVGNNPAGQAAIAAQAAAAKNKVLGEQLRTNQMIQLESRRRNLATLNDATLKNLGILDQQFMRQAQAKSATKAQAQVALSSIADKIARNKAETLQANVMSNMYPQYTFGPKGRVFNTGLTKFNIPTIAENVDKKMSRNGSIVKAIKNL